ncbi:MAG: glycogen/starch synthase, partial [Gallionellaceae bacterium]
MRVLFVSSEVAPIIKTGVLADVSGALTAALQQMGVDICV